MICIIGSKTHLLCFRDWCFFVPLTFDLAGQRIHCLGSVCRGRLQGCGLASRKEFKEK